MEGIINFETFLLTGILLNLTPGNDTVFILSRSIAQGKKAGIMSVAGIGTGSLVHTMFAAFGLSIIIAQSILLFNIVKYAGAAYLVFMGIKMLMDRSALDIEPSGGRVQTNYKKIFRDALVTNVLNPKVAIFFISFLPQFIDPHFKNSILPFLLLGFSFTITGTLWCFVLATFSSAISANLRKNKKFSSYLNKTCGLVLIGLGVKVAMTKK